MTPDGEVVPNHVRQLGQRAAGSRPVRGVLDSLEWWARRRADLLPVLTYHRVLPPAELAAAAPSTVSATPAQLDDHLRFLVEHRHVAGVEEVLAARRGDHRLPPGSVLLTFDDATPDFGAHAWPVLRRFGVPVLLFVPTAFPGDPGRSFWWDRLWRALRGATDATTPPLPGGPLPLAGRTEAMAAFGRLRDEVKRRPHDEAMELVDDVVAALGEPTVPHPATMTWDELRSLAAEGVALAPHTRTHPLLTRVGPETARVEIEGSAGDLARETGSRIPALAYPSGDTDATVRAIAGAGGVEVAFTTRRAVNDCAHLDADGWLGLARINVGLRASTPEVRAQLAPVVARLAGAMP